jgi:hypothetical protein
MSPQEIKKVQQFLRDRFDTDELTIKPRPKAMSGVKGGASFEDSAEVFLGSESIALLYRDDEDGDVVYQFQMTIIQEDLE